MIDRKLDSTGDIEVDNYDNPLVSGLDQIVQNLRIRLKFFFGEWFLDTRLGIPYFSDSFTKGGAGVVDAIIQATIKETPEINEILSYSTIYDGPNRKYTINFSANTIYGVANINNLQIGV
jgi:hypothetical protein